jgi:putative flippase GtrA
LRYSWLTGFILHLLTGVLAVAAHYSAMWLLLQVNTAPLIATSVGFLFGAVTRFFLSYFHIFSPTAAIPKVAGRFIFALAAQMGCNAVLVAGFLKFVPIWEAQVGTTITLAVFNYIAYRLWVFR